MNSQLANEKICCLNEGCASVCIRFQESYLSRRIVAYYFEVHGIDLTHVHVKPSFYSRQYSQRSINRQHAHRTDYDQKRTTGLASLRATSVHNGPRPVWIQSEYQGLIERLRTNHHVMIDNLIMLISRSSPTEPCRPPSPPPLPSV